MEAQRPGVVLDPEWTVNEVIRELPGSVDVFNRFGIDACCGGAASVQEAALRDGADPAALLEALLALAGGEA